MKSLYFFLKIKKVCVGGRGGGSCLNFAEKLSHSNHPTTQKVLLQVTSCLISGGKSTTE